LILKNRGNLKRSEIKRGGGTTLSQNGATYRGEGEKKFYNGGKGELGRCLKTWGIKITVRRLKKPSDHLLFS